MAYEIAVGETESLSIEYLDQNGEPMVPTPTPDTPPEWAQTDDTVQDLVAAADGLTATAKGLAAGSDTVQLTVIVGDKTFTDTTEATVTAPAQILTSVRIVATPAPTLSGVGIVATPA